MEQYTPIQRAQIVEFYIKNNHSIVKTQREFKRVSGIRKKVSENTIRHLFEKFRSGGTLGNLSKPGRSCPARNKRNIDLVRASVERDSEMSQRRRAQSLNLSLGTMNRILRKDLHLFPYKIQMTQQLLPADKPRRLAYGKFVKEMVVADDEFRRKIVMSDEANFELCGNVHKHNCRIYGTSNPRKTQEKPNYQKKLNVWCGVAANRIIGPYFYEDEKGATVTTTKERYIEMMRQYVMPQMRRFGMEHYWFQQDGAPPHTCPFTIDKMKKWFPGRLISKNGNFDWPPRSPDLTPPDFYLWGYLKSVVYKSKPQTLTQLKNNIRREIRRIPTATLEKVMEDAEKRAYLAIKENGGHLQDIIFHN